MLAIPTRADWDIYTKQRELWKDDAERYVIERLGMKPTWQQRQLLQAISEPGAKVSVRSGHGTGKSGATAGTICWFMETRKFPKIPCTAPTSAQLRDVLWAEISKWVRRSDARYLKYGVSPALWFSNLFRLTRDRLYDPSAKEEWYAVARTSGKDNPDALQGFHASDVEVAADGRTLVGPASAEGNILFVVDEAPGVFEQVFEVAEGALSSHGARLLMVGNPTKLKGYFADSHRKDRSQFTTLHFKSSESPLVDPQYRQRLVRKYGEGSNVVRVRADGEFPKKEDDVLISLEHAESAILRPQRKDNAQEIRLGVDVARFGNDRTVFVVRRGSSILYIEVATKKSTMWTTGRAKQLREKFGCTGIFVDSIGVGAGVVDRLRELREPVTDVNVATAAPPRAQGQGKTLRDHLWLEMATWLEEEKPSFSQVQREIAEDLAGELVTPRYSIDSSGRFVIESKDQQKKRLGHSCDLADGLGVTFASDGNDIFIG